MGLKSLPNLPNRSRRLSPNQRDAGPVRLCCHRREPSKRARSRSRTRGHPNGGAFSKLSPRGPLRRSSPNCCLFHKPKFFLLHKLPSPELTGAAAWQGGASGKKAPPQEWNSFDFLGSLGDMFCKAGSREREVSAGKEARRGISLGVPSPLAAKVPPKSTLIDRLPPSLTHSSKPLVISEACGFRVGLLPGRMRTKRDQGPPTLTSRPNRRFSDL